MLFCVCECALVLFVWVMVVGVGCSGWCCFQCCVAVVLASRRVPGVLARVGVVGWLVFGSCSGVGWLGFGVCVRGWGVCVGVGVSVGCVFWWFRMLMCLVSFRVFGFVCLFG